jgi:hypothetical protein
MTQTKWHAFVIRIHAEERISLQFQTIGECRRAQLHFNKLRRHHLENAIKFPHLYPDDAVHLYEPLTTEVDRPNCILHYRNRANADQRILEYLDAAEMTNPFPPMLHPFMDLTANGVKAPEEESPPPPKDEKKIWDPT